MEKPGKRCSLIFGLCLFVFAFASIQYFIWSDLFIMEFDSDNAETILWAQASVESGAVISNDFEYPVQLIPFGGHLLFIPFVKTFGVGIFSARLGFCVYSVLFCALLLLLFKNLGFGWGSALTASGCILLFTLVHEDMRDILWAHCVYYGMSVFFTLLIFNCYSLYRGSTGRLGKAIALLLLISSVLLGSINGTVIILYAAFPFVCAALIYELLRMKNPSDRRNLILPLTAGFVLILGFVLNKIVTADIETWYADSYSVIVSSEQWMTNLELFLSRWIGLFSTLPQESVPFFSSVGIKMMIRIGAALAAFGLTFLSFRCFGRLKNEAARIFILSYWIMLCAIFFFFVFGNIADSGRRLIPLYFSCLVVDAIVIHEGICGARVSFPMKGLCAGAAALAVFTALLNGASVFRKPIDLSQWYGQDTILKTLMDHGLTYGYCTNFGYANSITVLTDEHIKSRWIFIQGGTLLNPRGIGSKSWYDGSHQGRTFIVCSEAEYYGQPELTEGLAELLRASQYSPSFGDYAGYFILVYDEDPLLRLTAQPQSAAAGN